MEQNDALNYIFFLAGLNLQECLD